MSDLSTELARWLVDKRPTMLWETNTSAEVAAALSISLGAVLAARLAARGEAHYVAALRATFVEVDKVARQVAERSEALRRER